jgi:L-fucose isomerase-like protein
LEIEKYLENSKFIYLGETPSSKPDFVHNIATIEDRFGVRVEHLKTSEFYQIFKSFLKEEVKKELDSWKKDFEKIVDVNEKEIMDVTRIYLALRNICFREEANSIAINCGNFTPKMNKRGINPCLAFARLIDEGIMCACEGDIAAMLSSLLLHAVSDKSVLMGNFGYQPGIYEAREGEATVNHCLIPLSMASTKYVISGFHGRKFGVTGYAKIKADQPVTLLNMNNSLKKMCIIEGTTKGSEDGAVYDNKICRSLVRINICGDIERISQIVCSHHVSMTFGHWLKILKEAGFNLGFKVSIL